MGDKADRIEQYIEQQRGDCRDNLLALKQRVSRSLDWRCQFDERPLAMIGVAFGGGALLATLLRGRSRSRSQTPLSDERSRHSGDSPWGPLKGAVIALAASKLIHFAEELLPGFEGEYRRAVAGRDSA